jgi:2-oxoglutarate dehydrogenase E2 component (dihydrolipoamide succinyltransferase)
VEVPAPESGMLTSIVRREGDSVAVGAVLAVLTPGVEAPAASAPQQQAQADEEVGAAPLASPSVRRRAAELGVDLEAVQGTGPHGRITEEDVERAAQARSPAPAAPAPAVAPREVSPPPPAPRAEAREERIRMSRRRLTIARRLVEVQHTAAHLTTFNEVDMSAVLALRRERGPAFQERHGVRLGLLSFFTRAVVAALKEMPRLNAEIQGEEMVLKHYYDIGIAVSTDEGLVVPVLRDADRLSFAEIEREIARLAERARSGQLSLDEIKGGTFTITNGGVFGSLLSTPILNGPQVGILGLHKIEERPVAVAGEVVVRPMMYVALSYDHRIVDGAEAVRFLVRVKELVEDPVALLLDA